MSGAPTRLSLPVGGRLALAWVRCYTAGLKGAVRDDRYDEIAGDVWDHSLDFDCDPTVSRAIARRVLLGVPADLSWRTEQARRQRRAARERTMTIEISATSRKLIGASAIVGALQVALLVLGVAVETIRWIARGQEWAFDGIVVAVYGIWSLALLIGLSGMVSLARTQVFGSGRLMVATLLMVVPFSWSPIAIALGVLLALVHGAAWLWVRNSTDEHDVSREPNAKFA